MKSVLHGDTKPKLKALWREDHEPYYSLGDIDFWVLATVIDYDEIRDYPQLEYHLRLGQVLTPEETAIVNAMAFDGLFAAVAGESLNGDIDLCQEIDNFVRVIYEGCMTPEEMTEELRPK